MRAPAPSCADHREGHAKLVAAIAPERVEQVAGEAGGVQSDERRFDRFQVAHDQGHGLIARLVLHAVADDPPASVAGGQVGLGGSHDELLAQAAVLDQSLDGDDGQPMLAADLVQPLAVGHLDAVGDLAQDAGGRQARQAGEVDGRLGVPGAAEHAALLGHQREQMPRTHQVRGPRGRIDNGSDRSRPLLGTDTRPTRPMIDRHRERGLVRRRVAIHHRAELESRRQVGQDRHAELPPPVGDHEGRRSRASPSRPPRRNPPHSRGPRRRRR